MNPFLLREIGGQPACMRSTCFSPLAPPRAQSPAFLLSGLVFFLSPRTTSQARVFCLSTIRAFPASRCGFSRRSGCDPLVERRMDRFNASPFALLSTELGACVDWLFLACSLDFLRLTFDSYFTTACLPIKSVVYGSDSVSPSSRVPGRRSFQEAIAISRSSVLRPTPFCWGEPSQSVSVSPGRVFSFQTHGRGPSFRHSL